MRGVRKTNKKKKMALLLALCMMVQLFSGVFYSSKIVSAAEIAHTYYVGGLNASDSNDGDSSDTPLSTLAKAAQMIKARGSGDYNIVIQGGTNETTYSEFGNDTGDVFNITITSSCTSEERTVSENAGAVVANASGSAIIMRSQGNTEGVIDVNSGVTLNLGDSTGTSSGKLYLDGGYSEGNAFIYVSKGGTLNLYDNVTIQNNINQSFATNCGAVYNEGIVNMFGGIIQNNQAVAGGAVYNMGSFHMMGGSITANSATLAGGGIYSQVGNFFMSGGILSKNTSPSGGGLYITYLCNCTLSGGTISENSSSDGGGAVYASGCTINLSGDIAIPAGEGLKNDIYPVGSSVTISGPLSTTDPIAINKNEYVNKGNTILTGSTELVEAYHSLFVMTDSRYGVDNKGVVTYLAAPATYYVGGAGANDNNNGLDASAPLATLEKAIEVTGDGNSTIIVKGDLEITKPINITGNIIIKSDNTATHTIAVDSSTFHGTMMSVYGNATLTLGDSAIPAQDNGLIFTDKSKDSTNYMYNIFSNQQGSTININSGTEFMNFYSDCVFIMNFGTLSMSGGMIDNNHTLMIVDNQGIFNMSGGSIINNTCPGVDNYGYVNMSGGSIVGNGLYDVSDSSFTQETTDTISLSGSAYISLIWIDNSTNTINLKGNLSTTKLINIELSPITGRSTLLTGNAEVIAANYQKFAFPYNPGFTLAENGTVSIPDYTITASAKTVLGDNVNAVINGTTVYDFGSIATVTAGITPGYNFVGWYLSSAETPGYTGGIISKKRVLTIPVSRDWNFVAVYQPLGTVTITINGGTSYTINGSSYTTSNTGAYSLGSTLTVAVNDTTDFAYWVNDYGLVVSREASYTFPVTGAVTLTAVYNTKIESQSTVNFESYYGQVIQSTKVGAGDSITLPAEPTRYGYTFTGWSMTIDEIQAQIAAGTAVITVTPVYTLNIQSYTITITGGTGSGSYNQNDVVTATAAAPAFAMKFSHWTDAAGNILSYNSTYQFYATQDVTVIANYIPMYNTVEAKGTAEIIDIKKDAANSRISFVSMLTVPEGCTIQMAGIIATTDGTVGNSGDGFNKDTAAYVRGNAWTGNAFQFTWTKTVTAEQTWYVRAYLLYKDTNGNLVTIYGTMMTAGLNS